MAPLFFKSFQHLDSRHCCSATSLLRKLPGILFVEADIFSASLPKPPQQEIPTNRLMKCSFDAGNVVDVVFGCFVEVMTSPPTPSLTRSSRSLLALPPLAPPSFSPSLHLSLYISPSSPSHPPPLTLSLSLLPLSTHHPPPATRHPPPATRHRLRP